MVDWYKLYRRGFWVKGYHYTPANLVDNRIKPTFIKIRNQIKWIKYVIFKRC